VLQLVCEAIVILHAFFCYFDFVGNENGSERPFDDWPEDWHGGANDGEVDLKAGEDDWKRREPREIEVRICRGLVVAEFVKTPY
jgi:hypothetical protein